MFWRPHLGSLQSSIPVAKLGRADIDKSKHILHGRRFSRAVWTNEPGNRTSTFKLSNMLGTPKCAPPSSAGRKNNRSFQMPRHVGNTYCTVRFSCWVLTMVPDVAVTVRV